MALPSPPRFWLEAALGRGAAGFVGVLRGEVVGTVAPLAWPTERAGEKDREAFVLVVAVRRGVELTTAEPLGGFWGGGVLP